MADDDAPDLQAAANRIAELDGHLGEVETMVADKDDRIADLEAENVLLKDKLARIQELLRATGFTPRHRTRRVLAELYGDQN